MRHQCSQLRKRLTENDIVEGALRAEEETLPMSMRWFGTRWPGVLCEECPEIATPVLEQCCHCGEAIRNGETGVVYANGPAAHRNCFLRGVVGSLAHLQRRCSCYVRGSSEGDPPGMTARQAADAAVMEWERLSRPN